MYIFGTIFLDSLDFTTSPRNTTIVEFMTASLQCAVSSTLPNVSIEWWFTSPGNNQPQLVADNLGARVSGYSVEVSTCNLTLVVQNARFAIHQGTYTCRVQSRNVTAEESAVLTVMCKYCILVIIPSKVIIGH